jgi:PAS domain S-box-containing protein
MNQNDSDPNALDAWLARVGPSRALAAAFDARSPAAAFVVDGERRIVHWSAGAEQLLGFRAEEVLGEHCLKANRCSQCMQGCGLSDQGAIEGATLRMFRDDGGQVPVRKYARGLFDDDGTFLGGIEVLEPASESAEDEATKAPAASTADASDDDFHGIATRAAPMLEALDIVRNVAATDVTVLVRGESGTGKELVARAIHLDSHRRKGPFIAINCAALSPTLLESELFGHERGAFTGAVKTHKGVFERAHGGTLFLDEVAELPLDLQAKLLRVLQERSFTRLGGTSAVDVDVRIVSATHRSLREEVRQGRFREDLMYRLRVVPLFLPALRERRDDVPLLVERFLAAHRERGRRGPVDVAPDAMRALLEYSWPGNVRELQNAIEYACAVGRGTLLRHVDLPPEVRLNDPGAPAGRAPSAGAPALVGSGRYRPPDDKEAEAETIRRALEQSEGHMGRAAALLGMSRPTLWRRRKQYGL